MLPSQRAYYNIHPQAFMLFLLSSYKSYRDIHVVVGEFSKTMSWSLKNKMLAPLLGDILHYNVML